MKWGTRTRLNEPTGSGRSIIVGDATEPSNKEQEEPSPFGEPVVVPIEGTIDLHAFAPADIPSVVREFLQQSQQAGFHEVRIVHGRGKGVQRQIVRSILEKHPLVRSFQDAGLELGGWGATVVILMGKLESANRP